MARIAYADESGTTDSMPCYVIGVVSVYELHIEAFDTRLKKLREVHGFEGEPKWTRIRTGHGLINFGLDILDHILRSRTACFDAIVVHKELFRNWKGSSASKEEAFYQTYTYLLRHLVNRANQTTKVYIDDRSDSYAKRHEMVETIGNHMLSRLESSGRLSSVTKVSSKDMAGIQAADLITGAVMTAHLQHHSPNASIHFGKKLAMERMSQLLNWPNLCCDTFPHERFNIWHFPVEYRGIPESRTPDYSGPINYVTKNDLKTHKIK